LPPLGCADLSPANNRNQGRQPQASGCLGPFPLQPGTAGGREIRVNLQRPSRSALEIRPDDVTALLIAELEVTPEFRNYLAKKKLKQKYRSEWFAELIIDRVWPELNGG
jgi:hypothetical protein